MQNEMKECAIQEISDDLKQWLESHRQPFNKMLKDIYDDLFQKEFRKRLMWKDDMLWYGDPDQGTMYNVPDLACEIRDTQKYQDELVGPRGGLDSRNRRKGSCNPSAGTGISAAGKYGQGSGGAVGKGTWTVSGRTSGGCCG